MKAKTTIKKLVSVLLSFSILLPVFAGSGVEAATSLPHIEQIKTSGDTFDILEIVPNKNQGSLGYYIAGSEPWLKLAGAKVGSSERKTFVDTQLRNLLYKTSTDDNAQQNNYAIALCNPDGEAESDAYPLNFKGNYQEVYPWVSHDANYFEMPLDHEESATVKGTFTPQSNGQYVDNNKYTLDSNGNGNYLQLIEGFSKSAAAGDNYYYNVSFSKFSFSPENPALPKWSLIYRTADTNETADITTTVKENGTDVTVNLCVVGVVGTYNFPGLNQGKSYYMASWGAPSTSSSSATPYRAISSSFREKVGSEKGYFTRSTNNFKYVGTRGNYSFTLDTKGAEYTIAYRTVFYTNGVTNNNWFLKRVFDCETGKPAPTLKLNTVTPDMVTTDLVDSADLIVLNYGFNIEESTYDKIYRNSFSNDLSQPVFDEIWSKCAAVSTKTKTPIIFDYSLKDISQSNIKSLANTLISNADTANKVLGKDYDSDKNGSKHVTYVSNNQYCINSAMYTKLEEDNKDAYYAGLPLAIKEFNDAAQIFGDPMQSTNPFYPVYEDIYYENFLRDIRFEASGKPVDKLDQYQITMATSIRYIINSVKKREIADKDKIKVLDIEPRSGNLTDAQKTKLASWLGYADSTHLDITLMSTSEFVGKADDLRTKYDLIYIGDSTSGLYTDKNNNTVYTDNTMNGLIYSNIGDTVVSGASSSGYGLSGLIERDYYSKYRLDDDNTTRTFRYSGNDITRAAAKKLEDFAKSGYPIIVGDNLISNRLDKSDDTADQGFAYIGKDPLFNWTPKCSYTLNVEDTEANELLNLFKVNAVRKTWYGFYICSGRIGTADCKLYRNGELVTTKNITNSSPATYDLSEYSSGDKFYCTVTVKTIRRILSFGNVTNDHIGKTDTYTLIKGGNSKYVDVNSNMYALLNSISSKKNVKSWSAVDGSDLNKNLLKKFVNLSKPDIKFSEANGSYVKYPTVYSIDNQGNMNHLAQTDGANRLEYVFKIQNDADPLPQDTRYTCNLYVDMDSNGSFGSDETIYDIGIREWKNGAPGARINNGELVADKEYYVYYELPGNKVGFVPWKLVVYDSVYTAYDEEINYTRVERLVGEPQPTIEVLQINSDNGSVDLQKQTEIVSTGGYYSSVTDKRYYGVIGKLFADVSKDFNVNITTVTASAANNVSTLKPLSHTVKDKDGKVTKTDYYDLKSYLNSFNMLVLGFADSYGELNQKTTEAIASYIDEKRPVLMTHDVTSFYFLPSTDYRVGYGPYVYGNDKPNGYYANMLLRSRIGMDRYGVTDKDLGYTSYTPTDFNKKATPGPVANSYNLPNRTQANLDNIKKAGYDIAYKPKTQNSVVWETQGLTDGILARFLVSGKAPFSDPKYVTNTVGTTTKITQANKGQITTYPYNVNTNEGMNIAETHFQYFQLNMNAKDMTVWYCLEDSNVNTNIYAKNDAANNYYIYTCGNVTYSGMGHSSDINEGEAKLFVNTLIAAYRVTVVDPTVSFSNKDGSKKGITSFFIPSDGEILKVTDTTTDESRRIYFTINDSNVIQNKTITAAFSYGKIEYNPNGTLVNPVGLTIYDAETGKSIVDPVTNKQILKSTYTYYVKLDDVVTALNDNIDNTVGLKFNVIVTTTLPSGTPKTGIATITLRKLQLLDLT